MKKIAVGDLGEFWYGDYKEPFVQLDGAVPGYPQGVLLKDDAGRLLCAYCGKTFDNLGNHARLKHGLPAAEYKREVGLLQKSALKSERARLKDVANTQRRRAQGWAPGGVLKGNRSRANRLGGTPKRTPEVLNRTGRCYAQVLAVARSLKPHQMTFRELRQRGISQRTVALYFGTLDHLRDLAGHPRKNLRRWTDDELLTGLRSVAAEIGRTPSISDLARYGLPPHVTYAYHFGSYAEACRRAGLQANVPAADGSVEVAFLSAYSVTGNIHKACRTAGVGRDRADRILARYGFPFGSYDHRFDGARRAWAADMARRLSGWAAA